MKDKLDKQIITFNQSFEGQSEQYSKIVNKTFLPNLVSKITNLSNQVRN